MVLKIFTRKKPKIIYYRNYKNFNGNLFKEELNNELLNIDNNNAKLAEFTNIALSVLDKYQARKRKNICAKRFCVHDKRSQSSNNATSNDHAT